MRSCGRPALLGAAAFQDHDRLAGTRFAQYLEQPPPVLRRLEVKTDHFRLRVGEVELEQLGRAHVGAIARRDERRELESPVQPTADDIGAKPTALRNHADVPGLEARDAREADAPARAEHAHAVGADQPHTAPARGGDELVLQALAFVHLAEAAGDDVRVTHTPVPLPEQWWYLRCGNRDVRVVHGLRHLGETAIGGEPFDLRRRGMDRINRARVAMLAQPPDE
jgi:hypothetical protein